MNRIYLDDARKSWIDVGQIEPEFTQNFNRLWEIHHPEYAEVMIYGKTMKTPRYQQSYGKDYNFSGINHKCLPIPDELLPYLERANKEAIRLGHKPYNQFLINWYENGHHYIGKHRDSESGLDPNGSIFSLSLGAERKFRIRSYATGKIVKDILLTDGNLVVMGGDMQKNFTHEIVKIAGQKGLEVGRRINITCRVFL